MLMMHAMNRFTIPDPLWEDLRFLLEQARHPAPAAGATAQR
jgi:hypothetical protein